jgi:16S rRNA (adenine1518-N6/adenine1519-N6)-dimethyltransferase
LRAKKKYGQHFLNSEIYISEIAHAIVAQAGVSPRIMEVGPGRGALTKKIIDAFKEFKAVEIDDELLPLLENQIPSLKGKVIIDDFLKLDLNEVFDGKEFILTGNYPYNISSQIIFKMIEYRALVPVMIGMFQKEVAHRIIAPPNSKTYGILSVLTQFYYDGSLIMDIGPEAFTPPPKVDSSVILLKRHHKFANKTNESLFKTVVKQSFNQRRKMIRNTLKSFFSNKDLLNDEMFTKRPEHLSIEDFIYITNLIDQQEK